MEQEIYTSKFYIYKKKEKELCFKLDFKIKAFKESQKFYYVEICAIIDYQYFKNEAGVIPNANKSRNHWILRYDSNRWNFHSSIMLHPNYRSLGVGTFVINKMLEIALQYVPTAKLSGTLSAVDEEISENHTRRDRLYKSLGFIFNEHNTGFDIEQISDLEIRKDFDYIQEIYILDRCYQLRNLQYKEESDAKILKYYKDDLYKSNKENATLHTRNKLMFFLLMASIFLTIYLAK